MRFHHENAVVIAAHVHSRRPPPTRPAPRATACARLIATEIELGQQMETGRMVQLLRVLGGFEAADLDQPAMVWMNQPTAVRADAGVCDDDQIAELAELSGPGGRRNVRAADDRLPRGRASTWPSTRWTTARTARRRTSPESMVVGQTAEIAELNRLGFP